MSEFTEFRKKFRAWVKSIGTVADAMGGRIYVGHPAAQPKYPMATFALRRRRSLLDSGAPAWAFDTELSCYGPDLDALEAVHDAVIEALNDASDAICATLSKENVAMVSSFTFQESDEDTDQSFVEEGQTVHVLVMQFPTVLVKPEGGW